MSDDQTITQQESVQVTFDDGILYNIYNSEISVSIALDVAKRSLQILDQHHVSMAPIIADFTQVKASDFHLNLPDYAKIIQSAKMFHRISGIWIVGLNETLKSTINTFNQAFFGNKMQFAASIEEAKAAIKETKPKEPIIP